MRATCEACIATCNFGTKSAFALRLRKAMGHFDAHQNTGTRKLLFPACAVAVFRNSYRFVLQRFVSRLYFG